MNTKDISQKDKVTGCLLGLAVGDAVGTTVEFSPRGTFTAVTDMIGGGPFNLNAGEWTDDTSMALCLAHSLLAHNGFNAADQMERYSDWFQNGYMSSNGTCFDIGNTVRTALHKYKQTGDPFSGSTNPHSAGNGAIMRLAPIPIFYGDDVPQMLHYAGESARTTHGAAECVDACRLFAAMIHLALTGAGKEAIFAQTIYEPTTSKLRDVSNGRFRQKSVTEIRGNGYVVDSLEAALFCFDQTDTFRDAVLMATNLGDDADTTAAEVGQLAGAFYGQSGIPQPWLDKLVMRAEIEQLALDLAGV